MYSLRKYWNSCSLYFKINNDASNQTKESFKEIQKFMQKRILPTIIGINKLDTGIPFYYKTGNKNIKDEDLLNEIENAIFNNKLKNMDDCYYFNECIFPL